MLRSFVLLTAISFFEVFNYSRAEWNSGGYQYFENELAENNFIVEEKSISDEINELKYQLKAVKDKLSVINTMKLFVPHKTFNPFKQAWNYIKRIGRVGSYMANILRREYYLKPELKKKKEEINQEPLLNGWFPKGKNICSEAFKHDYFEYVKQWKLVEHNKKTIQAKKKWIRVQTGKNEKERRKFWRTSKICMAQDSNKRTFPVYISAARKTNGIFVFTKISWLKKDWINKWFFFWQTVVEIQAYLW